METTTGPLGFTIPTQTLSSSQEVNMTPTDIMAWRNRLPMADIGSAAKKVYYAIRDCNQISLNITDRFEILECLRPTIQFICQSLRKHYINQIGSLSQKQLTIAQLAQTLQAEMANGYKLIIEEINNTDPQSVQTDILSTALKRTIHYFTHIILRTCQLYSSAPKKLWIELHLIYEHTQKNSLLTQKNAIINDYKRALLLAASFPYQWRQGEQDAIYTATEIWGPLAILHKDSSNMSGPGFLHLDTAMDEPPRSPARGMINASPHSQVLDVNPILERIKALLADIEPNELQARMVHSNDIEYALSSSVLGGLLKEWGTPTTRHDERTQCQEPVKMSIGLMATHFYLNNQQPFAPEQPHTEGDTFDLALPTFSLEEEGNGAQASTPDNKAQSMSLSSGVLKTNAYPCYSCTLVNESLNGYGIVWEKDAYPPMQAGEVIGIERGQPGEPIWEVCKVRWLQRQTTNAYQLGLERLGKFAKAGAAQLLKEGRPAGYSLRCLLFDSTILLPTLPFKKGSQASIVMGSESKSADILELSELIDSTGSYKYFRFKAIQSQNANILPPMEDKTATATAIEPHDPNRRSNEEDAFGSVWSDL